ncbi:MAG TPA: LppX_LprAFG lipoprotein [Chloroflexia bacterium]|nr:LppX_LprAFG lipoprotein [Chloroflexia bacterium]
MNTKRYVCSVGLLTTLLLTALLAACGDTPTAVPTPTPTVAPPSARDIAAKTADRLKEVNSLHFIVDIKSGEVNLYNNISFKRAEGDYSKPDKYRAKLRVSVAIAQVDAETVGIGDKQWLLLKNLSNNWVELPPNVGFKASILFDPDKGLGAIVNKTKDLQIVGSETLDGVDVYHLKGIVSGPDIAPITASTLGKNDVNFDVWTGKSDYLVRQVTFKEISDSPTASDWQLNFSKFDQPVDIKSPV